MEPLPRPSILKICTYLKVKGEKLRGFSANVVCKGKCFRAYMVNQKNPNSVASSTHIVPFLFKLFRYTFYFDVRWCPGCSGLPEDCGVAVFRSVAVFSFRVPVYWNPCFQYTSCNLSDEQLTKKINDFSGRLKPVRSKLSTKTPMSPRKFSKLPAN